MEISKLFRIGDVAKLFHLSISSLRHYEEEGLLVPEYIDKDTGYRYYSTRQFEVLNTIRYLRALDMPLSEIADFLQNRDIELIEEKLRHQKDVVIEKQKELNRIERKIDKRLHQLHDASTCELNTVSIRNFPACCMVWMEDSLKIKGFLDMEAPIRKDEEDHFNGKTIVLPETKCVSIRFRGSHPQAPAQYDKLMRYIHKNRLSITGFSREITMIDYGITNDIEKFVTEISIPVTKEGTD